MIVVFQRGKCVTNEIGCPCLFWKLVMMFTPDNMSGFLLLWPRIHWNKPWNTKNERKYWFNAKKESKYWLKATSKHGVSLFVSRKLRNSIRILKGIFFMWVCPRSDMCICVASVFPRTKKKIPWNKQWCKDVTPIHSLISKALQRVSLAKKSVNLIFGKVFVWNLEKRAIGKISFTKLIEIWFTNR